MASGKKKFPADFSNRQKKALNFFEVVTLPGKYATFDASLFLSKFYLTVQNLSMFQDRDAMFQDRDFPSCNDLE